LVLKPFILRAEVRKFLSATHMHHHVAIFCIFPSSPNPTS
jgi:hypothetical protein